MKLTYIVMSMRTDKDEADNNRQHIFLPSGNSTHCATAWAFAFQVFGVIRPVSVAFSKRPQAVSNVLSMQYAFLCDQQPVGPNVLGISNDPIIPHTLGNFNLVWLHSTLER